nr:ribonuclease H-like domain-containing protein [Tanacetum cinerariifolium]
MNQDSSRRTINVEETTSNAMVAIDGACFDWSYMADDEVPTNMALMDFSDFELDLSNSGLEEFQQPEFEGYEPKTSNSVSKDISNEVKESLDALLVKELVSDDKNKTFFPTVTKIEFVRPKQQEKPVKKQIKYAKMYRSQCPRGNQRNWNNQKSQQLGSNFVMYNKACLSVEVLTIYMLTAITIKGKGWLKVVNTARLNSTVVNAVRANQIIVVKASACNMSYLYDFKEFDRRYVTFRGGAKKEKITGKGTLKIGKLDFEDVYFVKELQFNFLSVSQMTLIKVARTMLADSKLPTTFWAEAVNTPALYRIGYSLNSKDFRVYNVRTRKVEENLHIRCLKDKPIITGTNSNNFIGTEECISAGHASK